MRRFVVVVAFGVALVAAACSESGSGRDGAASDGTAGDGTAGDGATSEIEDAVDLDRYLAEADEVPLAESDAAEPPVLPSSAGGASGYSRYVFREYENQVLTSLVEGPLGRQTRCQEVELPCSYEELAALEASGDPIPEALGLEADELTALVAQLDVTRAVVDRYADVDDACRDGYLSDRIQTPNMGSHFTRYPAIADGVFDPAEPEILIYAAVDGREPTSDTYGQCVDGEWTGGELEIVAASFILLHHQVGDDHPEGFAGDLDNWHVHYNLCRGAGTDAIVPEDECRRRGGRWSRTLGWMIHAWVAPGFDNQLGAFSMWNPTIWPATDPESIRGERTATVEDAPVGTAFAPIENFSFGRIEAEPGKPVVWTNSDSVAHTVTAGSPDSPADDFDSGVFAPGDSYQLSFDEPGEYAFFCALHPDMVGTVVVE